MNAEFESVPCCFYLEFLLNTFEDTLRGGERLMREHCTQLPREREDRDGITACNYRRIFVHSQYAHNQIRAIEYFMLLLEECKRTRNWGRCESTTCGLCLNHQQLTINRERFPNVCRVYEFWMVRCRHVVRMNFYPETGAPRP